MGVVEVLDYKSILNPNSSFSLIPFPVFHFFLVYADVAD